MVHFMWQVLAVIVGPICLFLTWGLGAIALDDTEVIPAFLMGMLLEFILAFVGLVLCGIYVSVMAGH